MQELIVYLNKRRKVTIFVVFLLAIIAILVSFSIHVYPSAYFHGRYNMIFVYALIAYKIIELFILSYVLFYRHLNRLKYHVPCLEFLSKLKKHAKLLLFLIPQGNTVFGIIAYKLSGNVLYFLIFSLIALLTLFIINPNSLKVTSKL
jgi:hypothetical protein